MAAAPTDRRAIITDALRKIDDLTARLKIAEKADTEPIAVVGIGCRLPGGVNGADEYWKLLLDGVSGVGRVPLSRWDADEYYSPDYTVPGTICNREGGFITSWQPDEFDAEFFSIAPREAAGMDPQQRLLLEVAWEALENAGINPRSIRGSRTGIFVGMTTSDYYHAFAGKLRREDIDPYIPFGSAPNFAAGRLSYFLGVRGPAVVLDTACSSSLVSVHLAVQSLRSRESDYALAAGVNLILSPENSIACSRWGMLAPDGLCKTFDADANGYVRSEGCGVVVLKRLADAQHDGDRVLAIVRGSAVNQDGASSGQTVPNGPAQQALMRQALAAARVQPSDIDYVEAHGTGTALGDPIELDALSAVFGERNSSAPLVLGSVKTNLGHLESASGIAGFIKTVLSVYHGFIPKQLHFKKLTPQASAGASRFTIAAEPMQWPRAGRARRAGVSSFGVSGTNAHVVLEQAPEVDVIAAQPEPPVTTLVVTGKTPARIASLAERLADWMLDQGADVAVADVAHTLNHHRARHGKFATVTACDRAQAIAGLRALAGGYPAPGVAGPHDGTCGSGTVFLYSGQGSQWAGMGRRLLCEEPAFAAAVAELDPVFTEQVGFSLREVLESGEPVIGIDRIQPVLVGVQLALTELWRSYGVQPNAVIGHSMGEVTAAVVAGALSPADGLKVIATRSRLMARLSGQGAMALLELDDTAPEELIAEYPGVTVAVYASPRQVVIAGPPEQVDAVIAVVDAQDRLARRVDVDVASHHPIIDPVLPDLRTALADLSPQQPRIPIIITTDGRPTDGTNVFDAEHWAANLRNPVRFARAVAAAGADNSTFIEVSPHPLLAYAINDALADIHHHTIGTLQRDTNDTFTFHSNLNATHTVRPPETPHPAEPCPVIPATPWHHTSHWIATSEPAEVRVKAHLNGAAVHPVAVPPDATGGTNDWFLQLAWPVRELPAPDDADDESWLVLADADLAGDLARLLGATSRLLAPSVLEADTVATGLPDALTGVDNVVFAPSASPRLDIAEGYRLFHAVRRLAAALAGMATGPKPTPQLHIVTRNAQPIEDGDRANPAQAVLWGLGRTLALENPEVWGGIIDVDDSVPPELVAHYLRAEAANTDGDDQAVYQGGVRRVPRLERRSTPAVSVTRLESDTSHLVIGATGNVGPYLVRQLAEMGASTIVAVSRRGGALQELAAEVASSGTTLVEVAADASDEAAMAALFGRFGKDLPPLDGIYLAALAGGEVLITEMTDYDVNTMFRSKLDTAAVLHKLTLTMPVRRFVLFSSITGILGSRWLGHYTAANTFLDTLAYARRSLGLAGTVIDWGLWKSWAEAQPGTKAAGLVPMPNDVAIRLLPSALGPDSGVQSVVVAADWSRLADAYRMRGSLRVVDHLLDDEGVDGGIDAVGDPSPGTLLGDEVASAASGRLWRARLVPAAKPYPGGHRIRGVEVVPVSVLLQTLAAATEKLGGSILGGIRFEYPIVADQQRVIHVVADGDNVTVWSSPGADTPQQRWTRHASARISDRLPDSQPGDTDGGADRDMPSYDGASVAALQRTWGIEGQPFPWSVGSCEASPGGLRARIRLPEASAAALLDAAVHVARLADSANPRLMLPAAVDGIRFATAVADTEGVVEVRRRAFGDELVVDILAKAPDGSVRMEIRGLRYAAVESAPAAPAAEATATAFDVPAWSTMSADEVLGELRIRLRAILARELGMPAAAVDFDMPFPELGLDSMMAMNLLRDAKQLVQIELSATMLWNHPTILSFAEYLAELLAPEQELEEELVESASDSVSVLDALFDSVESAPARSESGI